LVVVLSAVDQKAALIRKANQFQYSGAIPPELFAYRKEELEDAMVVCEQIVNGATGGILVLGGRGTGKSSFIAELSRRLDLDKIANARISLDEGMVEKGNEPNFFRQIIEDLTEAAQTANLLERQTATKVKQILQGVINLDSVEFSAFGIDLIARSAQDRQKSIALPYAMLRDGLKDFLRILKPQESGKPSGAILMLDEGDDLTQNRVLLQVLRNVFQELRGMGLVIAGTSRLLTEVSEVFSPIPRFFRKIDLGPFPTDEDVTAAITKTVDRAKSQLLGKGIRLEVVMHEFIPRVIELSDRVPLDFSLLSYFAYDLGSKRLGWNQDMPTLYMRIDKEVLDEAITQLRGTKEYAGFLDALTDYDRRVLELLSRCITGASVDELAALLILDGLGESLRSSQVDDIIPLFQDFESQQVSTAACLSKMLVLGDKYRIKALNPELVKKAIYRTEDQWVKAYFRYSGMPSTLVDLQSGLIFADSGILFFGDPISSILDSIFLSRFMKFLDEPRPFKVNSYPSDGAKMSSDVGKILNTTFQRVADGQTWHFAVHVKSETNTETIKSDITKLMVKLQALGLVRKPAVKERVKKEPWISFSPKAK
jgi:hypothetical protein